MSAADTWANRSAQVNRGLKRKAPAPPWPWIFGRSTMMRYPLMHASSRLKSHCKKMKGGTIFGKSTRMHQNPLGFPSAHPEREALEYMMKRMKGGNPFRWLKKRIQIDFPDQLFPFAFPIADLHKTRRAIKRGRR